MIALISVSGGYTIPRQVSAVVLAGGDKSLIEIEQKPMLGYVLDALQGSSWIGSIHVTGPDTISEYLLQNYPDVYFVRTESDAEMVEALQVGLRSVGGKGQVVLAASDAPLISSLAIDDLVERSFSAGSKVCYPLVEKGDMEREFPGSARTWIRLRDGHFTGGNLMFVDAAVVLQRIPLVARLIGIRKKPIKLVSLLGLTFLLKLLVGRLSMEDIDARGTEIIDTNSTLIRTPFPEIGIDIDKSADLDFVRRILDGRARELASEAVV